MGVCGILHRLAGISGQLLLATICLSTHTLRKEHDSQPTTRCMNKVCSILLTLAVISSFAAPADRPSHLQKILVTADLDMYATRRAAIFPPWQASQASQRQQTGPAGLQG